jgi:hypothetical protein
MDLDSGANRYIPKISIFVQIDGELKDGIARDENGRLSLTDPAGTGNEVTMTYDNVFDSKATEKELFNEVYVPQLEYALAGYRSAVFGFDKAGINEKQFALLDSSVQLSIDYIFLRSESVAGGLNVQWALFDFYCDTATDIGVGADAVIPVLSAASVMSALRPASTAEDAKSEIAVALKQRASSGRSHTLLTLRLVGAKSEGWLSLVNLTVSEDAGTQLQGTQLKENVSLQAALTSLYVHMAGVSPPGGSEQPAPLVRALTSGPLAPGCTELFSSCLTRVRPHTLKYEVMLGTLQYSYRWRNDRPRTEMPTQEKMDALQQSLAKMTEEKSGLVGEVSNLRKSLASTKKDLEKMMTAAQEAAEDADKPGEMSKEKLRKALTDTEDMLREAKSKIKERKEYIDLQAKEIHELTGTLIKTQTALRAKEHAYTGLEADKVKDKEDLEHALEAALDAREQSLLAHNSAILTEQHALLSSVPETLRNYTAEMETVQQRRLGEAAQIRDDRDKQVQNVKAANEESVVALKKQYEHWLHVKDETLQSYLKQFNDFKSRKTAQLEAAEAEMVRMYSRMKRQDELLTGVEKGDYQVLQNQGSVGRPTTGTIVAPADRYYIGPAGSRFGAESQALSSGASATSATLAPGGLLEPLDPGSMYSTVGSRGASKQLGSVQLGGLQFPKGLRPTNPLLQAGNSISTHSQTQTLSDKVAKKHAEQQRRKKAMREEALKKDLALASQDAAFVLSEDTKTEISEMLKTSSMIREQELKTGNISRQGSKGSRSESRRSQSRGDSRVGSNGRGVGFATEEQFGSGLEEQSIASQSLDTQSLDSEAFDGFYQTPSVLQSNNEETAGAAGAAAAQLVQENAVMKAQIAGLKRQVEETKFSRKQAAEALESEETLVYVVQLEESLEVAHKGQREQSALLHSSKVANASLQRRLDKMTKLLQKQGVNDKFY